jgi:hypothetical protein
LPHIILNPSEALRAGSAERSEKSIFPKKYQDRFFATLRMTRPEVWRIMGKRALPAVSNYLKRKML